MEIYSNNYKITATNYNNNFCYVEGIFDVSNFVNTTINLSVDSILESDKNLSFTLQQINSNDTSKQNSFKQYFLATTPITTNSKINLSKPIDIKYNYLILLLGVKLSGELNFTNPFDFIYRFTFKINDNTLSPVYFGGTVDNIAEVEVLDSEVITPSDNTDEYATKEYVDNEIKKFSSLITEIQVYPLEELDKIDKKDNILYLGYWSYNILFLLRGLLW